ncbi:hypothetical protein ACPEAN_11740 [Ralstonia solanacearum]|uniref:hypothetical protein n=1 Tax=Ralstonia solanacearum TaxID=305 RepID=UPI00113FF25E|nr:hypothetical protein [Ralstonia solanacearum]
MTTRDARCLTHFVPKGAALCNPALAVGSASRSADFADSLKPASLPGRAASQSRSTRRPPVHDPPCLRRTGVAKQLRRHLGTAADLSQIYGKCASIAKGRMPDVCLTTCI